MPNDNTIIDVLIATDCISAGQNLQDCDFLVNYDIHWNPVRIIQRFGRIDRIGSRNQQIQLVNFWPDLSLDEYINLNKRVSARMTIVNATATADDNIISEENEEEIIVVYEVRQIQKTREQLVQDDRERCLQMFAETLTDEQALQVPLVFNEFEIGVLYKVGTRILYNDVLYKVLIEHTSQETWAPDVAPSLFAKVLNETLDGSIPQWEQPDSANGYMKGDKVMFDGKTYESLIDNNVWSPLGNPTCWLCLDEEIVEPKPEEPKEPEQPVEPKPEQPVEPDPEPEQPVEPEEPEVEQIPEWVQPHAGNPYKTGDKVMFEGKAYVSLINGNVWSPTAYPQGWQLV